MTTTPETLSTRLRAAADDITFIGRMDPHRDAATLREAAERIESLEFDATAHERHVAEVVNQAQITGDPKRFLAEIELAWRHRHADLGFHGFYKGPEAQLVHEMFQRMMSDERALQAERAQLARFIFETFTMGHVDEASALHLSPGQDPEPGQTVAKMAIDRLKLALQRRAFVADWSELESLKASVEGYRKHMQEIGQYLITAHARGAVDEAAVAILDGYHVGATPVAGGGAGEPGEHTLGAALRLLKLAASRGAFAPGKHIHTPAGPMLELAAEAGVVGGEEGLDITVLAEHLTTTFAKLEDWIRSDGPLDDGEPHLIAMTEAIGDLDQLAGELRVLAEDARIAAGRLVTALEYPQDHQITVMEEAAVKLDSIAAAIEPGHVSPAGLIGEVTGTPSAAS